VTDLGLGFNSAVYVYLIRIITAFRPKIICKCMAWCSSRHVPGEN